MFVNLTVISVILLFSKSIFGFVKVTEHHNLQNGEKDNYPRRNLYPATSGNNCSFLGPSQHAGRVLHGTLSVYHIYLGNAGDYTATTKTVTTLTTFAQGISNSMYAKMMLGYPDQQGNSSSYTYVYKGSAFLTGQSVLTDSFVYNQIVAARDANPSWKTTSIDQSLYLVIFRGDYSYASATAGSSWNVNRGWCGFHSNNIGSASGKFISMVVGGMFID